MGKTVVFDGKMGMRKFGSTAPPFGKVACAVKVFIILIIYVMRGGLALKLGSALLAYF